MGQIVEQGDGLRESARTLQQMRRRFGHAEKALSCWRNRARHEKVIQGCKKTWPSRIGGRRNGEFLKTQAPMGHPRTLLS